MPCIFDEVHVVQLGGVQPYVHLINGRQRKRNKAVITYLLTYLNLVPLPSLLRHWTTTFFHRMRSIETLFVPLQVTPPIACRSSLKMGCQVFCGLPCLRLRETGSQFKATLAGLSSDERNRPRRLVGWLSGWTSVSYGRTFTGLHRTCSWWVTIYMGKPSAVGQPTRPTQPFILTGSINE